MATCTVAGKAGELFENHGSGVLAGVPWPVPTSATASIIEPGMGLEVYPRAMVKTERLVQWFLDHNGLSHDIRVDVRTHLVGRGMATSTATMRAGVRAAAALYGIQVPPSMLGPAMAAIEPCDADVEDGRTCLWDFQRGIQLSDAYNLPEATWALAVPTGEAGIVRTDDVDRVRPRYDQPTVRVLERALQNLEAALATGDLEGIARVASRSIEINIEFFPNPLYPAVASLLHEHGVLGIFGAHSGSALGVIASPEDPEELAARLADAVGPDVLVMAFTSPPPRSRRPFLELSQSLVFATSNVSIRRSA